MKNKLLIVLGLVVFFGLIILININKSDRVEPTSNIQTPTTPKTPTTTVPKTNTATSKPKITPGSIISPTTLPAGKIDQNYYTKLSYNSTSSKLGLGWNIIDGVLPPGLRLNVINVDEVSISGIPTKAGSYTFTVSAKTAAGINAERRYTMVINEKDSIGARVEVKMPNGRETFKLGSTLNITWQNNACVSTCPPNTSYNVNLIPSGSTSKLPIVVGQNKTSYLWSGEIAGSSQTINPGEYKIEVCATTIGGCDMSDNNFSFVN